MKKILNWIIQILLIIWQLPQIIVALFMLPFLGDKKLIKYDNYCWAYECEKMSGAISLGCFIFLSRYSAKRETTIAHEYGHVKQSHILSWCYLILGMCSLMNAWLRFTECYYDYWTESWANKLAGLGVDSLCRLYFLDKPDYKK